MLTDCRKSSTFATVKGKSIGIAVTENEIKTYKPEGNGLASNSQSHKPEGNACRQGRVWLLIATAINIPMILSIKLSAVIVLS